MSKRSSRLSDVIVENNSASREGIPKTWPKSWDESARRGALPLLNGSSSVSACTRESQKSQIEDQNVSHKVLFEIH